MVYERFTDRALESMRLAEREARRVRHERIGAESILLALLREGGGVAVHILKDLNVDLSSVGPAVRKRVVVGPEETRGKLPLADTAKRALESSVAVAIEMSHAHIGTEHLLLGVLHEQDGIAACALRELGVTLDIATAKLQEMFGPDDQ